MRLQDTEDRGDGKQLIVTALWEVAHEAIARETEKVPMVLLCVPVWFSESCYSPTAAIRVSVCFYAIMYAYLCVCASMRACVCVCVPV